MMKSSHLKDMHRMFLHYMLSAYQLVCVKCFQGLLHRQLVFIGLIRFQNTLISIRFPTWLAFGIEVDLFLLWASFVVHVYGCCLMDCSMYNIQLFNVYTNVAIALAAGAALLPMPIKAMVSICYLVLDGKYMFYFHSTCCVSLLHS